MASETVSPAVPPSVLSAETAAAPVPAPAAPTASAATAEKKLRIHPAGLSSIEQVFFKSPASKPQVIMCFVARFSLPPKIPKLKVERLIDVLRKSEAQHYRLSSYVDPQTAALKPFAKTAKDLPLNYRFLPRKTENTWREALHDEVNTNFDVSDSTRPLWRSCIILPEDLIPTSGPLFDEARPFPPSTNETKERLKGATASEHLKTKGFDYVSVGSMPDYFEIVFTFHHCLGDGLSAFAFCRTFGQYVDDAHMNADSIDLEAVKVSEDPPVNFDSLFNPWLIEIIPVACGMALNTYLRNNKMKKRLKEKKSGGHIREASASSAMTNSSGKPKEGGERPESPVTPTEMSPRGHPYTRTRSMYFDPDFMHALRNNCRSNKTTISSLLVVVALAATRTYFASSPKYTGRKIPNHQGWVCTTSLRHLLPNSTLMKGGNRQEDPSVKVFGGYAGSIAADSFKLTDSSNIWERSRAATRALRRGYGTSIGRMKLVNYLYRRPKLWEKIQKKADLGKYSRRYSIEIANMGAWDNPTGEPDPNTTSTENRIMLDHFFGAASASFDGVRALFSIGGLTVTGSMGQRMGMGISYDASVVSEEDADVWLRAFTDGLDKAREAGGKAKVGEIRQ
ncbi:hypothetical protein HDV05_005524 [Chytridiales sp. JEL 0842]|nr:hypothetical protein HDV05_005524 [Chytridiales sp. JEL 0842]